MMLQESGDGGDGVVSMIWNSALTVIVFLSGLIMNAQRREIEEVKKMAADAAKASQDVKSDVAAHKLYASEKFATKGEILEINRRIEEGFDKLDSKIDDRFDKLDERLTRYPPRQN